MPDELSNYHVQLEQEVLAVRDTEGLFHEDAFSQHVADILTDAGEFSDAMLAGFRERGVALNAWAIDEDETVVHLLVSDFRGSPDIESLTATQIATSFKRLTAFVERSFDDLADRLEPSNRVWEVADRLRQLRPQLTAVHLYLASDANARKPTPPPMSDIAGIPVTPHIWDLERFFRLATSGRRQESIEIRLADYAGPLPCLAGPESEDFRVFLLLVPAPLLAGLYDTYGSKLLERNVRSFLEVRGAVNKGIRNTILNEADRFLAYNNGISATAENVDLVRLPDGTLAIAGIRDLQIVNGGQTTASLHRAWRKDKVDLTGVTVQAKLTVVAQDELDGLVGRISAYANTQNKVTGADLSANNPYHVAMEGLSRSIWAPATGGTQRQTRWFYERARGQYTDELARAGTAAQQRQWKQLHPTAQRFTKTDLAKFEHSWEQLPHLVSLGAEKNFQKFMAGLGPKPAEPDETAFRHLIAKCLLFKAAEKVVTAEKLGGYRANVVAYSIARLAFGTDSRLDLEAIWRQQAVSEAATDALRELAKPVHDIITHPTGTVRHIGEWCKKEACWQAVKTYDWSPSRTLRAELIGVQALRGAEAAEEQVGAVDDVADTDPALWFRLSHWAKMNDVLTPWQRQFTYSLGQQLGRGRQPSERQAVQARKALSNAIAAGFDAEAEE